ncbi:DUF4160 domain-containing protein [Spirosoma utsteinense]|uniref:DUF4160 domain-containing protein n=1 Tax=Spirosoma utsteinense TaxID=2585773 RepID=A0ABR6W1U5_9BACT|nr:hypothetical protein [Spirosoma utsteinense]MBC3790554.1 hypothetical protein [Spirosoma utsteinense]
MPTLFRLLGFRFFYRLFDLVSEPCHIHVGDDKRKLCKFWIFRDKTVELADFVGFSKRELKRIEKVLLEHIDTICQTYEHDCITNNTSPNYKAKKS